MRKSLMRYILAISVLFYAAGCSKTPTLPALSSYEKQQVETLHFDETLCQKLKGITNSKFRTLKVVNQSGQEIPATMLPKMIYFKLPKNFDISILEEVKTEYKNKPYNIYTIDQHDDSLTLVVSKL